MKKFYYFASAVLLALCTSCGDDNDDPQDPVNNPGGNGSGPTPPQEYVEEPENDPSITHDFDITDPNLLFYDDFNQKSWIPRKSRWELCPQGSPAWAFYLSESYNQSYVDTDHGELVLSCEKSGSSYATGGVQMKADKAFKYGKVEVKARFALSAKGGWPAIWMMPSEPIWSGWPQCGEIDIMERLNHDTHVHHVIHTHYTDTFNPGDPNAPNTTTTEIGTEDGWNIYGIEWTPDKIDFYVNGTKTFTYPRLRQYDDMAGAKQWPFDTKFYLILNHAGGKGWPGEGSLVDSELPAEMRVDWVKVWKLE